MQIWLYFGCSGQTPNKCTLWLLLDLMLILLVIVLGFFCFSTRYSWGCYEPNRNHIFMSLILFCQVTYRHSFPMALIPGKKNLAAHSISAIRYYGCLIFEDDSDCGVRIFSLLICSFRRKCFSTDFCPNSIFHPSKNRIGYQISPHTHRKRAISNSSSFSIPHIYCRLDMFLFAILDRFESNFPWIWVICVFRKRKRVLTGWKCFRPFYLLNSWFKIQNHRMFTHI